MRKSTSLPPELGSVFAAATARDQGVSAGRLRGRDLDAPFHGARMIRREQLDGPWYEREYAAHLDLCATYAVVAPPEFQFSHVTAALLYGMPLPRNLGSPRRLHVLVAAGKPQPRGRLVAGHRGTVGPTRTVSELPVVAPEVAWLQLAPLLSLDELVVAGDYLVRRKQPWCTFDRLMTVVEEGRGGRGLGTARAALRDIRPLTDSPPESVMRLIIVRAGLPEPRIRFEVWDDDGYFVGTPDLAYVLERIAIEYEGEGHRKADVFEDDIVRREMFERAGWRVVRVTQKQLRDPVHFANRIAEVLALRAVR